ncbi:MAG: hypothetical protein J6X62_07855 [Bacteroidales bacterium]|nr:hypothetical protein [Bacteroidales bacterium]
MKKQIVLTTLSLLMFASCGNLLVSPNAYQEEIEDVVKYNIAVAMVMSDTYSKYEEESESASWFWGGELTSYAYEKSWEKYCDSIDIFEEYTNELWNQIEDGAGYYTVLNQVSQNQTNSWNNLAGKVFEKYNAIDVIISEYQKVETSTDAKIWKFTELNTGLVGVFSVDSDSKWHCDITESSLEKFFNNLIQ